MQATYNYIVNRKNYTQYKMVDKIIKKVKAITFIGFKSIVAEQLEPRVDITFIHFNLVSEGTTLRGVPYKMLVIK